MFSSVFIYLAIVFLAVVVGWLGRRRLRRHIGADRPRLGDDDVRRILREGRLEIELDEPLDPEEIEREEERFWSETWDEPEEYP